MTKNTKIFLATVIVGALVLWLQDVVYDATLANDKNKDVSYNAEVYGWQQTTVEVRKW